MKINRAPVLTLWAKVVAMHMGYSESEALALGKAVAGYTAQLKGRSLGIYTVKDKVDGDGEEEQKELQFVDLLGRQIPTIAETDGIRVVSKDKLIDPDSVQRYLQKKFGEDLDKVMSSMEDLAKSYTPDELNNVAFRLYEKFRPEIPRGKRGWGAKGELDPQRITSLKKQ